MNNTIILKRYSCGFTPKEYEKVEGLSLALIDGEECQCPEILFINRLIREIKRVCEIDRHPNIYKGNYDKVLEMITQNSIHRRDLPKSILLSIGHICL